MMDFHVHKMIQKIIFPKFYSIQSLTLLNLPSYIKLLVASSGCTSASMGITPFTPLLPTSPTTLQNCSLTSSAPRTTLRNLQGSPKFQNNQFIDPLRTKTPAPSIYTCLSAYIDTDFQYMKTLIRCNKDNYGAQHLHAYALWLIDCPCYSFMLFVTA